MRNRRLVLVALDHASDVTRTIRAAVAAGEEAGGADVEVIRVVPHRASHIGRRHTAWPPEALDIDDGARLRWTTLRGRHERVIPAYAALTQASLVLVERDYGSSPLWRHPGVVEELARESPAPLLVLPKQPVAARERDGPRHVVMPADFSVASAVALRTGVELSRRRAAQLTLVHALADTPRHMVFGGGEALEIALRHPARVNAVAERLRHHAMAAGAGNVETTVVSGQAARAVADAATDREADTIVIGVPRRSWIDRLAFGSTLRGVLRRATVPVLIVPVTAGGQPLPIVEQVLTRRRDRAWLSSVRASPIRETLAATIRA